MSGKRVLIIEDEEKMARYLELELNYEGYTADVANDGLTGYERFLADGSYDMILLDIMMPGADGLSVLRQIRERSDVPVILITCKGEVQDKVTGLDAGADDYIAKPFAIEELLARMRVVFKKQKTPPAEQTEIVFGPLTVNTAQRMVHAGDENIDLTKTEFELLLYLIQHKNAVSTRKEIMSAVWGSEYEGQTNIVDVYIRYLRTKIDERLGTKIIRTIRGVGYYAKE